MLVANLAMVRGVKAVNEILNTINKEYWIIIIRLSLILLCVLFLTIKNYIECLCLENIVTLIQLK